MSPRLDSSLSHLLWFVIKQFLEVCVCVWGWGAARPCCAGLPFFVPCRPVFCFFSPLFCNLRLSTQLFGHPSHG
jgi:hypothetical protein